MRYVALISGGKDSCFNLLHCAQNGHTLVAAASLGPGVGKDEIDSYLYQTVGQDAIQLVADALEVPLLRRVITGTAVQQGSEYGSRRTLETLRVEGDETEDLFELLSEVKAKFPDVEAVSVGAILSNYQRVRVEHVCQRLALTPLCYLWQRDQSDLLAEMIGCGTEAILIKVAGIGLTAKHLGKTLTQMQPVLLKLGAHVCGEGGEYESLTLDSPLFKRRIVLEEVETIIHSDNDFATVAFLKVKRASLQKKVLCTFPMPTVPKPRLLHEEDQYVSEAVSGVTLDLPAEEPPAELETYHFWKNEPRGTSSMVGSWVVVSNVEAPDSSVQWSIDEEVRACFKSVQGHLVKYSLDLSYIASVCLLISSMELFPAINKAYASLFGISPPARACIAVDLPAPSRVRLECIAYAESQLHERQCLHVQSLSYWAPANIGPYSQAITVGQRVFVSGQIGLVPSSNMLPSPQSLPLETALSLRHLRCVTNAIKPSSVAPWDGATQGVISWLAYPNNLVSVKRGMDASKHFCPGTAPTLFIVVRSLPKNALVETQILLHTTRSAASDGEDGPLKLISKFSTGQLPGLELHWEVSYFDESNASFVILACSSRDDETLMAEKLANVMELQRTWQSTLAVRLFHTPRSTPDISRLFRCLFGSEHTPPPVTAIPSRAIATWGRNDWDYALCFIGSDDK